MKTKRMAISGVVLIILMLSALSTSTVFAHTGHDAHTTDVLEKKSGANVGSATLTTSNGKVTVNVTTRNLAHDNVYSVWGKINGRSAFNLTGFISDAQGGATFDGSVEVAPGFQLHQFEIILKDHGDPLPEPDLREQKTTKGFNCGPPSCPSVQTARFKNLTYADGFVCSGTIPDANLNGSIIVPTGTTCVLPPHKRLNGGVEVLGTGRFEVLGTVNGTIEVIAAGQAFFVNGRINGSIISKGAGASGVSVVLGGEKGSTVHGGIKLVEGSGDLAVVDGGTNTVKGDIKCNGSGAEVIVQGTTTVLNVSGNIECQ